ncbi:MAG: hypothetical protein H7A46_16960 [Verrucomicrobiales bacterium]|nr:hypothetical protein [Verrucomicrobiales bacterium]
MNQNPRIVCSATLAVLLAVASAGCRSSRPEAGSPRLMIPPRPSPIARPANVWHPEVVVPYAVGRYVDPLHPDVLHEAHTVFRRERSSQPNLAPPAAMVFPAGNAAPESAADVVQFYRDALTAELNSQRETSAQLIDQSKQLQQSMERFNDQTRSLRQVLEGNAAIRSEPPALTNRVQKLERQLEEGREVPLR